MSKVLSESFDFSSTEVDDENCVIKGVRLLGKRSRNKSKKGGGRIYEESAIEDSSKIFENCLVTVRGGHDRKNREALSQNGFLRNGRIEGKGSPEACSRYDWQLNPNHETTKAILWDARHNPRAIPLSHEVMRWEEEQRLDEQHITKLHPEGIGVAIVYNPGVNTTLFEEFNDMSETKISSVEELRKAHPDFVRIIEEDAVKGSLKKVEADLAESVKEAETLKVKLETAEKELDELKESLVSAEQEDTIRENHQKLFGRDISDKLLEQCLKSFDDHEALLESIKEAALTGEGEGSGGGSGGAQSKSGLNSTARGSKTTGWHNFRPRRRR